MPSFHFPLEKILRWRQAQLSIEEAKQKKLLQEQVQLQTLRADLSSEKAKLSASLDTLAGLKGEDLRAIAGASLRLKHLNENLTLKVVQCERNLAAQKKKYQAARQRCRLLEELKARRESDWKYEQARELETLASESYLAKWNRDRLV